MISSLEISLCLVLSEYPGKLTFYSLTAEQSMSTASLSAQLAMIVAIVAEPLPKHKSAIVGAPGHIPNVPKEAGLPSAEAWQTVVLPWLQNSTTLTVSARRKPA